VSATVLLSLHCRLKTESTRIHTSIGLYGEQDAADNEKPAYHGAWVDKIIIKIKQISTQNKDAKWVTDKRTEFTIR